MTGLHWVTLALTWFRVARVDLIKWLVLGEASQFSLAWTGSTGSNAMTASWNHTVSRTFSLVSNCTRKYGDTALTYYIGNIILTMLSFLTFSTFQSLSLFPQDWPLRTTKLCSIYTSGLQHTLEIFFPFRTVGRYVYKHCLPCHLNLLSSKLGTWGVGWALRPAQAPTSARRPPRSTRRPLTLILLTASWACIMRTFLEGVLSERSWVEPR